MRIITLMENCGSENKALLHEHGLSFYIEHKGRRFLFDCGSGNGAMQNARKLGIVLEGLDAVILSHNHYDHATGYRDMIEGGLDCKRLYTGCGFFVRKYAAAEGGKYCDLSSGISQSFLDRHRIRHDCVSTCLEIAPEVYLLSSFERTHAFEQIPERFIKETEQGFVPDDFSDEIALAIKTVRGIVVFVGCSHPGILNMLQTIYQRFDQKIYALFGGTHLVEADEQRISETMEIFKMLGIELLGMNHCSGQRAENLALTEQAMQTCHLAVGDTLVIE